jgi:cysteine desulfurase
MPFFRGIPFPIQMGYGLSMSSRLYFDYNASAPLAHGLPHELVSWLANDLKNPSSLHHEGQKAKSFLERARKQIYQILGASAKDKLVFTSGGTEANNAVLQSALARRGKRQKMMLTRLEHDSVLAMAQFLEKECGVELVWIPVHQNGDVDWHFYEKNLDASVFLVTVMLVNNETGFVLPVKKMVPLARERGALFHTDAVCATGKWPYGFEELGADFLTFSSHKFGGLKGVGGILCRAGLRLEPLLRGGKQEAGKRAGTENIYGVLSTAYALEKSLAGLDGENQRQEALRKTLIAGLKKIAPDAILVEAMTQVAQTVSVIFPGLAGMVLQANLDLEGVAASYGSACASGSPEASHVVMGLGYSETQAKSALRFSFGRETSEADISELILRLKTVLDRMYG